MNEQKPLEPWQWPEEHWRQLVNQVRAGRTLRPKAWKDGARCAFAISFDSDHETNELREGGKSIGRMAWGQYGNRVGVPRILKLLKKYDVPATFYVPAVAALQRLFGWVGILEFIVLIAVLISLGPVARAWLNAWGLLLFFGVIVIGMLVPFALSWRRDWLGDLNRATAAVLVILGGFILRLVIVFSAQGV